MLLPNGGFSSKRLLRKLYFHMLRPKIPVHPEPFRGPVLVVGSAPESNLPDGFDDTFHVITINGSQNIVKHWGIDVPDVTFMQFRQIYGTNDNAVAVRRVLSGERTGLLYVVRWAGSLKPLIDGLADFNYRYAQLQIVSRYERMAMFNNVTGVLNCEDDLETKFSNGVTAILYAINSGAQSVVISGINPKSTGHVYNDLGLIRHHSHSDGEILQILRKRGYNIYTADPEVALSTRLPLWTARSLSDRNSINASLKGHR